eukprot:CAMPEP_0117682880 /NCGR_PEP_ID=MMETSP0804-20121206/19987_1 /TAXON_ID=1074897 /ORGANISM="Tetraselmis astigmatica, Strain CCMP880" /LENGTH=687 /DNA_ID=CAMNT_0005493205 /DNA_START=77 /DNA_END=2140 /DNA_ORIENTATION=+
MPATRKSAAGTALGKSQMPQSKPKPKPTENGQMGLGEDGLLLPTREVVKPENQLELSEKDLDEEIAKMLTTNNPSAPANIARFDQKLRAFKHDPMVDMNMIHYSTDGWLLHNTSDEAKKQNDLQKLENELTAKFQAELAAAAEKEQIGESSEPPDDSKQLRNSFNYSDRAAQTFNTGNKDKETMTEPPPTATRDGSCTQFEIYDEYVRDQQRIKYEEELAKAKTAKNKPGSKATKAAPQTSIMDEEKSPFATEAMSWAAKLLERTVNQNSFNDIAQDFKYWDDASDQFREGEGTLLPLWKFYPEKAKKKHVTSICWNPQYLDMFAVTYGSFDFMKQGSGLLCVYSLKNPSYPEYIFSTDSGVMCCDFHPQHSNLLAVGLYDGTVLVYDTPSKHSTPIYRSTVKNGKHTDPVWQVFWAEDEPGKPRAFFSVSSDGRVTMWMLSKSMLEHQDVLELKMDGDDAPPAGEPAGDSEEQMGALSGGCCFDFNKETSHLFVVGTEEGHIHKCSTAYNSQYLQTYEGHAMAVYSLKWNHLHPQVFLSASADWTVKLWNAASPKHVMAFDLNNTIGDVAWAPYSSTVFAAVTTDGKVNVFDLNENKHEPMCEQKVVRKSKLTKIAWNPKYPVILVGDDRGCVTSLKLSPNLRKVSPPANDENGKAIDMKRLEVKKLDRIMEIALKSGAPKEEEDA